MKLKYKFQTIEVVGEMLAIPVDTKPSEFQGALRINEVTADILNLLKNDTTESEVVKALQNEYNASYDEISANVHKIIDQLRAAELLTE